MNAAIVSSSTMMMKKVNMEAFCCFLAWASFFWAVTISLPFPAGTTLTLGSLGSSGLW